MDKKAQFTRGGEKKVDSTTFDPNDRSEKSISESMVDIVKIYQSLFLSKQPFASNVARNMSVSKPSRSQISCAGK